MLELGTLRSETWAQSRLTPILGSENIVEKLDNLSLSGFSWLDEWVQDMRGTLEDLTSFPGGLTNLPAVRWLGLVPS